MATETINSGGFTLTSTWTESYIPGTTQTKVTTPTTATRTVTFPISLPAGARITKATVTATLSATAAIAGNWLRAGTQSVDVPISATATSKAVEFAFKGSGAKRNSPGNRSEVCTFSGVKMVLTYDFAATKSTFTCETEADIGQDITLQITHGTGIVQERVKLTCGSWFQYTDWRDTTESTWTVTIPEEVAELIPTEERTIVTVMVTSRDAGGTDRYYSQDVIAKVPESAEPIVLHNPVIWRGDPWEDTHVTGYSWAEYPAVLGIPQMGATIAWYVFEDENGEQQLTNENTYTTGKMQKSGPRGMVCGVIDSRGRKVTRAHLTVVQRYAAPTIDSAEVYRVNENGERDPQGTRLGGTVAWSVSEIGENSAALTIEKSSGAGWVQVGRVTAAGSIGAMDAGLDANTSYSIRLTLADDLMQTQTMRQVQTAGAWMVWDPERDAIGFGCYPDGSKRLCIAEDWDLRKGTKSIFDLIYPVGSIYMSVNAADPATLFGGEWERLKDRFLLAAGDTYTAGATGGEATHTLSKAELPEIGGTISAMSGSDGATAGGFGAFRNADGDFTPENVKQYGRPSNTQWTSGTTSYGSVKLAVGEGAAHNNMPPYEAVYIWKRKA